MEWEKRLQLLTIFGELAWVGAERTVLFGGQISEVAEYLPVSECTCIKAGDFCGHLFMNCKFSLRWRASSSPWRSRWCLHVRVAPPCAKIVLTCTG